MNELNELKFEDESGNEISEVTKNKVTKAIDTLYNTLKEKPLSFTDDVDYDDIHDITIDKNDLKNMIKFDPVVNISLFEDWEGNETIEVHLGTLMFLIKNIKGNDYLIISDREILLR